MQSLNAASANQSASPVGGGGKQVPEPLFMMWMKALGESQRWAISPSTQALMYQQVPDSLSQDAFNAVCQQYIADSGTYRKPAEFLAELKQRTRQLQQTPVFTAALPPAPGPQNPQDNPDVRGDGYIRFLKQMRLNREARSVHKRGTPELAEALAAAAEQAYKQPLTAEDYQSARVVPKDAIASSLGVMSA